MPTKQAKLIFGLQTTATNTTVEVTATIDDLAPQMTWIPKDDYGGQIAYTNGKWTKTVSPGQHVFVIEVTSSPEWFEDVPAFTLSASSAVVIHLSSSPSNPVTQAWLTQSGTGGGPQADPKDPWPPPGTAYTLSDPSWFASTLSTWYGDIANPRGEADVLPAFSPPVPPPG